MKKITLWVILFAAACFLAYKLLSDRGPKLLEVKDRPLRISKNSGVFNTAFSAFLGDYYSLKDAMILSDSVKASKAAFALAASADSLPIQQLQADTDLVKTALSLAASVSGDAKGVLGESGMEARRRDFNMLTDEVYQLILAVGYDGELVYHFRCQTAFGDSSSPGFWLNNSPQIVNPYAGPKNTVPQDSTTACGELVDSLGVIKK